MIRLRFLAFATLLLFGLRIDAQEPGIVSSEFIFETAPFAHCHASTLAETKAGLVAAWFGGEREGHSSVGIWLARHLEGKWTTPIEVANGNQPDGTRLPCWNPVLFQPRDGPLLLFYKVGPDPQRWWCMRRTSDDLGKTWSEPTKLPEGFLGPIKSRPIQLSNGDLLCPSSTESVSRPSGWRVHFERSPDLGITWTKSEPPVDAMPIDAIQPNLLVHKGDRLQAVGRTRAGRIFSVWSEDLGKSWSKMELLELPNNNSGTDACTLRSDRHLLVYNHTLLGRSPLNVAVSSDGKSWQAACVLEKISGEFSYPTCLLARDGLVHIVYTYRRQRIKHVVLDSTQLHIREMPKGIWPAK